MRNSWKGLVVGGLTGALVGVALDLFAAAFEQATRGAEHVRERAPEAAEWLQSVTDKASEWVHDADVPEKVRIVAQRILDSDVASAASATASKAVDEARGKARSAFHSD